MTLKDDDGLLFSLNFPIYLTMTGTMADLCVGEGHRDKIYIHT